MRNPTPLIASLAMLATPAALHAQTAPQSPSTQQSPVPGPVGTSPTSGGGASPGEPGFTTQLFGSSRGSLLGDIYGLRTKLGEYGVSLGLSETSEMLGNVTGGTRRAITYEGLTIMSLGVDTQKAFGWEGGTFNVSAFQIHGRALNDAVLNLNTPSGISAERATRLWELWYQQAFLNGRMDVKVGQQSLDAEFIGSTGASTFINTMMGWPVVPSYDLYAGGPAYPLSSLGVRLRGQATRSITVLGGVFNDNPPGGPFDDDDQVRGASQSGTKFNLNTGALIIAEVQYALNQPATGDLVTGNEHTGLPGTYKLGAWFDTANFPDQRFDNTGLSLADPNSTGIARMRRHNFSVYGVMDQTVWRPDEQEPQAIGVFARIMGAPGDRNLIDFGINAGVVLKAPLPGRDDDSFGIGYGLANVGGRARRLDTDTAYFSGAPYPRRSSESFIEITYQAQIAPWWQIQPDFQYVFTPGGGILDPNNPARRIGNEAIFALRTNIVF